LRLKTYLNKKAVAMFKGEPCLPVKDPKWIEIKKRILIEFIKLLSRVTQ
jgi:hypothetical protein